MGTPEGRRVGATSCPPPGVNDASPACREGQTGSRVRDIPASTPARSTKVRTRTGPADSLALEPLQRVHGAILGPMTLPALIIAQLIALLVSAGTATATYRVGFSEQSPAMFSSPAWQSLALKRVRYIVAWDWAGTGQ